MTTGPISTTFLNPAELLPSEWQRLAEGPLYTFNPGLIRSSDDRWILAYRVVGTDGRRRIGICRLDRDFGVVAGSAKALSDSFSFKNPDVYPPVALDWFADPRLIRLQGRLFIYWNSGWHEPRNHQFLQELDERSLHPVGTPRELVLEGAERRKLEKNWMLFESGDRVLAVYSVQPHRVLACELSGTNDIVCRDLACVEWSPMAYPACHGGIRGGAPPQSAGGLLWSFCHTVHDGPDGYVYRAVAYAFSQRPPFSPSQAPFASLPLYHGRLPARRHVRLNPAVGEVIYPCGAIRVNDQWVISWGLNDETCAVSTLSEDTVHSTVSPRNGPL